MNNAHVIAKLVSSQIARDLTKDLEATIVFQIKPAKKWIRGRFEEIICRFTLTETTGPGENGVMVDAHVQYRGVDGTNTTEGWRTGLPNGGYNLLTGLLLRRMVFDLRGAGLVFAKRTNEPAT